MSTNNPKKRISSISVDGAVQAIFQHLDSGGRVTVFDLETTGLKPASDRILSFSGITVYQKGGVFRESGRLDVFINPGFPIPPKVTEINGISDATVVDCGSEYEVAPRIREFLGPNPVLAGYNSVAFDEPFVDAMWRRVFGVGFTSCMHLDVMAMARQKLDLQSYKLEAVAHELGADRDLTFHRGIDDVVATGRSMTVLLSMYNRNNQTENGSGFAETDYGRNLIRPRIRQARFWQGKSHILSRIYIETYPYIQGIFYDVYRKEWVAPDDVDLHYVRDMVWRMYGVRNDLELKKQFC